MNENQKSINQQYYILVDGEKEYVSEELYRAYKRPQWAESKRKQREKRCRDENGHRCTKDCSKCEKQKTGAPLSLDELQVASGFDALAADDVLEAVMYAQLLEKLGEELEKLNPTDRLIMALFGEAKTEREIALILKERAKTDPSIKPLCQKSVCNHKNALFTQLYEALKDYR